MFRKCWFQSFWGSDFVNKQRLAILSFVVNIPDLHLCNKFNVIQKNMLA